MKRKYADISRRIVGLETTVANSLSLPAQIQKIDQIRESLKSDFESHQKLLLREFQKLATKRNDTVNKGLSEIEMWGVRIDSAREVVQENSKKVNECLAKQSSDEERFERVDEGLEDARERIEDLETENESLRKTLEEVLARVADLEPLRKKVKKLEQFKGRLESLSAASTTAEGDESE